MTEEQIQAMFEQFDTEHTGYVEIEKYANFMKSCADSEEDEEDVVNIVLFVVYCTDTKDNGKMDHDQLKEFFETVELTKQEKSKEFATILFGWLDQNKDGYLEGREITRLQGFYTKSTPKEGEKDVLKLMDSDKDGKISKDEFVTYFVKILEA
ncbi:calmodulin-4, putative [Entamoeba invadens IP1]|uniref:Calmodulin-4, putative n=1 Tax=Entamoeba invadens IP1 TaxID=370355 RepID=A0A0A1U1R1_ENTIV|nr:calmodulin-4, putative [Entamoeba invadens IP1]ELP86552.1 calmodulin-4, putative [Entamoeba invadens IP1]|eukprot:XP_004185898.1 calmodulin-4, putative [Entamoeba invadens IP1]